MRARGLGFLLLLAAGACRSHEARPSDPAGSKSATAALPDASGAGPTSARSAAISAALATLRSEEASLRAHTDFATQAPSSRSFGPNPYALTAVPDTGQLAGILRGDSRVVLLDASLRETASLATAASPSALASMPGGRLFVASPLSRSVERFHVARGALVRDDSLPLPADAVTSALVADARALVLADFVGDRLLSLPSAQALAVPRARDFGHTSTCAGPIRLAQSAHFLAVACLFDHSVQVLARDEAGAPGREVARVVHDGPLWSVALLEHAGELFVAAGGVEDHPLERRERVFGYVDSFVYLYALAGEGSRLERREAWNVAELGVVTPKALALELRDGAPSVFVTGYASDRALELRPGSAPSARSSVPGCSDLLVHDGQRVCADPLLDAWVLLAEAPRIEPVRPRTPADPTSRERLGEALFFTTLMAPDAASTGRLSRFTCETCHFEGKTDGRVHNSGRNEIRVSTRPLFGLFNDAPHFSRAHDRDLTSVCQNEFAVANRGNPVDPWFSLEPERFAWLAALGVLPGRLEALELRRALLEFLARFTHEENPFVAARAEPRRFSELERRGAALFERRCASCHAARLIANDPATLVPFESWEALTLSAATPLVWARGDYEQTGVLPYVDAAGTRIPSLRRLYLKRPYFTNGTARTLAQVLERARCSERAFFHAEPSTAAAPLHAFDAHEQSELLAFLRLL